MFAAADLADLSRTNSPACVVGAFPARLALRAFSIVRFSGIIVLLTLGCITTFASSSGRAFPTDSAYYQCAFPPN